MRRQRAQRGQLAADQCQLRLYQALMFIHLLGHLFKSGGERFFGITVNRYR